MSYYEPQEIAKAGSNYLFVRASNSLYLYNMTDNSITTFDRTQQLSDSYVETISWNEKTKRLLVFYDNANIDLIDTNGNVKNISGLYLKSMTQNKRLYHICMNDKYAYLSTGFGIVKIDMEKAEISESYIFDYAISKVIISGDDIYARRSTDVIKSSLSKNLMDPHNWEVTTTYPDNMWKTETGDWDVYKNLVATLKPEGPKHNYFGFLKIKDNVLYTSSGTGGGTSRPGTVQIYDGKQWTMLDDDMTEIEKAQGGNWKYVDTYCVDVDPFDSKHIYAGGRPGLFEFYDGKLKNYFNKDNSILRSASSSNKYVLTTSAIFDDNGDLWLLQQNVTENSIIQLTHSGQWNSYPQSMLLDDSGKSFPGLSKMIMDSRGLLWFVNHHYDAQGFFCFDPNTKKIVNSMVTLVNQDGVITDTYIPHCIAEDIEGNLWLGAQTGLYLIEESTLSSQLNYVTQVKVPRNDGTSYADYLMDGVNISCIAVDQANRKWIGTNGAGLYLISADNMEQLENFTSENSPLLSDNIESLEIDHNTGEVFIGTDRGLCSYMSDAIVVSIEMTKDNVYAYPNPVVSGYDGLITVVGLTRDADVKILTVNGQLVAQGRSNGGSFTWNGRDSRGHRVASGIYMVATATSDGKKGTVCKIAVIR
jgi:hypothetical protein